MGVHPSAIVNRGAELASGVEVGPYSIIGKNVKIGKDTIIESHVIIDGHTEIGENNHIYHFTSIGFPPQDVGYRGEDTRVRIGNNNQIREYVTINRATIKENWETVIGNDNFFMAYAHVAHDCILGNGIIMSNVATLGGHTKVGDYVFMGGLVAVHQFVRIGDYAYIGGKVAVAQDIPPFMLAAGAGRARLFGPNQKGLRRQGFSRGKIEGLKKAYRLIWRETKRFSEGIRRVKEEIEPFPELDMLIDFISSSRRGITR